MPQVSGGGQPSRTPRLGYWVAAGLLAVSLIIGGFGIAGLWSLSRQIGDFQRVPAPGRAEITFTQPGGYVLYAEKRSGPGFSFTTGDGPFGDGVMDGSLVPVNGGAPVPITGWSGTTVSYGAAGYQGQAVLSVTIPRPGRYVLTITRVTPRTITGFAVGRSILPSLTKASLLIVAGVGALVAAGVVLGIALSRRRCGQAPSQHPGSGGTAPVEVGFAGPFRQRRVTVAVRLLLAIPQLICLAVARYVLLIVLAAGWFWALFTGRLPGFAAKFLARYQQWGTRLAAYLLLLTDAYPPLVWEDYDYPVSVGVEPGRLNRFAVFFRVILAVPAWLVWEVLVYGLGLIVMFPAWLVVLVMGRMPRPLYEAIAAIVRYGGRLKGYLYLLTDVYPAGLFGDQPEPALASEAPQAVLPGDYAPAAAVTFSGPSPAPGPLVLSRTARRLVGLSLGVGTIAPFALFAALSAAVATTASPGPRAAPAAVSSAAPGASGQAQAPSPSAAPGTPEGAGHWMKGLRSLRRHMYGAMGSGAPTTVTAASLRSAAAKLGRCSAELAALGPPPGPLRPVYQQASQACDHFERGAACYAAAAKAFSTSYAATAPGAKFPRMLNCGDAAVNRGSVLIGLAVADGAIAQSAG